MNFSRNTKLCLGFALAAGAFVAACSSDSTTTAPGASGAGGGGGAGAGVSHAGATSASAGTGAGGAAAGMGGAGVSMGGASVAGAGGAAAGTGGASAGAGGANAAGTGGAAAGAGGAVAGGAGGASAGTGGASAGTGGASAGAGGANAAGSGGASAGSGGAAAGSGGATAGSGGAAAGSGGAAAGSGGTAGSAGAGATPCGGCVDLKVPFDDASETASIRVDLNNAGIDLAGAVVTASVKIVTGQPDALIQLYLQDVSYASDYPYVSIGSFGGDTASFHDVVTTVPSDVDGGTLPYDVHHVKQLVFQLDSGSVVPEELEVLIDEITITGAPAAYAPYTFDTNFAPFVSNGGSTKADGGVAPVPVLSWIP